MTDRSTVSILGCEIDALDMDATVARCDELIRAGGHAQHVAINVAKLVALRHDPELAAIVRGCSVVSADGQGVVWAGRLLGARLPERVAGIDLMDRLLALCAARGYGVYVLGARPDVLERALEVLQARHAGLRFAGWRDGYFQPDDEDEVCDAIRSSGAKLLLVAISSPRKEQFLARHGAALGIPLVMGVGGSIDVAAGVTRRAPLAWQRLGLEWMFRLLQEPRRMWRRYATTNARFAWLIAREFARR